MAKILILKFSKGLHIKPITQNRLIIIVSIFLFLFGNYTFFLKTLAIYPASSSNIGFLISLSILLITLNIFIFAFTSSKYTTKPILIIILIISSLTAYFMDTYHIIIDTDMIRNVMQTELRESLDLISIKMITYFVLLGLFPSYLVYITPVQYRSLGRELLSKIVIILISFALMGGTVYLFSKHYTSFIREHKPLRYNINPSYWIYSIVKYTNKTYFDKPISIKSIGKDATIKDKQNKKLVIMVVGETARADHFSLNGYGKETNPKLKELGIINYPQFYSCGTSTAVSVPCMFSRFGRDDFDYNKGIGYENVLDILDHTGKVSVLWRDNNSNSKGVANRLSYQDYKTDRLNPNCENGECRDIGMLDGLDKYIEEQNTSNILIVFHQMGNHGPAYYKRYPKEFSKFKPTCKTNQLEKCTTEEISNAYDNALLYTDTFLAQTIEFLKQYDSSYKTAMLYVSDHGESLGENGVYLHGMPYFMAPETQIHVGALLWLGESTKKSIDIQFLKKSAQQKHTHDEIFHTILGLFDVDTNEYNPKMDFLNDIR